MDKAKEISPEVIVEEEIVPEAAEEVKEAPSRPRGRLRELGAVWGRASIQFSQAPKD